MSSLEEAFQVVCAVLKGHGDFKSCADLATALREACDDADVTEKAKKLIENEMGIGFRR